jgi:hypothetical protein
LVNITVAGTTYLSDAPVLLITHLVNISGGGTIYLSATPVLLITLVNISGAGHTYLSATPVLLINPFGQHFWSRNYLSFCCTCFIDYLSAASVLLITLVNISQ